MTKCKIRITQDIPDLFPECQPKVGEIYDAEYIASYHSYQRFKPICIIDVAGKRIIVREGEFEILEGEKDG